jgi:ribose 5-phosphate isomerase B
MTARKRLWRWVLLSCFQDGRNSIQAYFDCGEIMRIGIGSDLDGFEFKERLRARYEARSYAVQDVCTSDLDLSGYQKVTDRLASAVRAGRVDRAVLICTRAIGASVAANKYPGVRAAWCHEPAVARRSVEDDNLNFLVIPAPVAADDLACQLADIFIVSSPSEPRRLGMAPRRLARVIEYIKSNIDSPLAVSELCRLAGLSESQFSKLFKFSTGLTPHQFILHERINCSKEFLGKGMSIVKVALEAGFSHQAHFTTVFRNVVGMTPRQYRLSSFNNAIESDPVNRATFQE